MIPLKPVTISVRCSTLHFRSIDFFSILRVPSAALSTCFPYLKFGVNWTPIFYAVADAIIAI